MGTNLLLLLLLFEDISCVHLLDDVLIERWQFGMRVVTRNASAHNLCDDVMRVDVRMI